MTKQTILVVDDNPDNLRVLSKVLESPNRDIRAATSGPPALELIKSHPVDLILLDINMPGLDGYEVCRRLKSDQSTQDIPVLFLSAKIETEAVLQGFNIGGADYIKKPFEMAEVEARVSTHLELRHLQKRLQSENRELEARVQMRTSELQEALAKLSLLDAAKDDFLSLISHEMRTPLNGMMLLGQLIQDSDSTNTEIQRNQALFQRSFERLVQFVDHALVLTEIKVSERPVDVMSFSLPELMDATLQNIEEDKGGAPLQFEWERGDDDWHIHSDGNHLNRAIDSLLKTTTNIALREGKKMSVTTTEVPYLDILVEGIEYSEEGLAGIFDILGNRCEVDKALNLGIAPAVAHRIFEFLGAFLSATPIQGQGTRFRVDFCKLIDRGVAGSES